MVSVKLNKARVPEIAMPAPRSLRGIVNGTTVNPKALNGRPVLAAGREPWEEPVGSRLTLRSRSHNLPAMDRDLKGTQLAQHSAETNEHYTPAWLVDAAREVLGGMIDLDPASCPIAQEVVQAAACYADGSGLGGLAPNWHGNVFLNPPGGRLDPETLEPFKSGRVKANGKKCSAADGIASAAVWFGKLWGEWDAGRVHSAIFICFSMSVFRTTQDPELEIPAIYQFPFCVPRERVNYDKCTVNGARVPTKGAPADSAIVYLPPRDELDCYQAEHDFGCIGHPSLDRFEQVFGRFGYVRI